MGDKRPSTRTLPNGQKVTHHPDGTQVLIPTTASPLRERLDAEEQEKRARFAEQVQALRDAIDAKKASQQAKGLPAEKSPI